ncbi:MAG: TasA family protein [Firmicutes bacterium]|nr:TasA family protein [Bacillota bacterium]
MGLKTKLAMGLIASATGAAMMAGGTFAMFTASATNSGNTFTAGTLNLSASSSPAFASTDTAYTNLAPGDTGKSSFTVTNTGNLTEYVGMNVQELAGNAVGNVTPPNIFTDLSGDNDPLTLTVTVTSGGTTVATDTVPAGGSTAGTNPEFVWVQAKQTTDTVTVSYNFPSTAGNAYQGASGIADFNLQAVQARNNGETVSDGTATFATEPTAWS